MSETDLRFFCLCKSFDGFDNNVIQQEKISKISKFEKDRSYYKLCLLKENFELIKYF